MNVEFGINSVERNGEGEAKLVGRVFSGVVCIGSRFSEGCNIEYASVEKVPIRTPIVRLALSVTKIVCYGREMDALDEGLTGCITVRGDGIDLVAPNMSIRCERKVN